MRLIQKKPKHYHVSHDTIVEFEQAILKDKIVRPATLNNQLLDLFFFAVYYFSIKLGFSFSRKTQYRYKSNPLADRGHLLALMMGLDATKFRAYGLPTTHCRSIYLFDAWPASYEAIINFINYFKIDFIFVSSSQSSKISNSKLRKPNCYWVPEGIDPTGYKHYNYDEKNIDVIAIGRKYNPYHEAIVADLEKNKKIYCYEKVKGQIIFPTRAEFIEGIARSKISICVPSNISHPDRAGNVETMTNRYLQSMISKCLIIGYAPKEMVELFGYNPVVEIDMDHPAEQLKTILQNYSDYYPLIEKNYHQVRTLHSWENRWERIKSILSNNSTFH